MSEEQTMKHVTITGSERIKSRINEIQNSRYFYRKRISPSFPQDNRGFNNWITETDRLFNP